MKPLHALPLLLALAGCVAPEPPPVVRQAAPRDQSPPRTDLEPAPRANRAMKAPDDAPVLQIEGMGKPKKPAS